MERILQQIGTVPVTTQVLQTMLPPHKSFNAYISRLEQQGDLIRLKKGMYVVSPTITNKTLNTNLIANHLYGPSYVSFQTALRHYGLIEDLVQSVQSATLMRSRQFTNSIAHFAYTQLSVAYYPIGIKQEQNDGITYLIATPEKALCDLIITTPQLNIRYQTDLMHYLEDDLRFEIEALQHFDSNILEQCLAMGKKKTAIEQLLKLTRKYGK